MRLQKSRKRYIKAKKRRKERITRVVGVASHVVLSCWARQKSTPSVGGDVYRVFERVSDEPYSTKPVTTPRDRRTKIVDIVHVIRLKLCILPRTVTRTSSAQEDPDFTGRGGG